MTFADEFVDDESFAWLCFHAGFLIEFTSKGRDRIVSSSQDLLNKGWGRGMIGP